MSFKEKFNARMEVFKRVANTLKCQPLFNKFIALDVLEKAVSNETLDIEDDRDFEEKLKDLPLWEQEDIRKRVEEADATLKNPNQEPIDPEGFEEFKKEVGPRIDRMMELTREFWALNYCIKNIGKDEYKNEFKYKVASEAKSIALKMGCRENDKFASAFRIVAFNAYADCYTDLGKEPVAEELRHMSKVLCQEHNIDI